MAQGDVQSGAVSRSHSSSRGISPEDLFLTIRRRSRLWDVAALAAVPAVLAYIYTLPTDAQTALALSYTEPTILTAFTSHYVHISLGHLLVNVVGYVLVVPLNYLLAVAGGRRQQFLAIFFTYLLLFPFVLSGFNLLWGWTGVRVGFSGIVIAFVGYLPIALFRFVNVRFGLPVNERRSLWLFFVGLAVASYIALPSIYGVGMAAVAALTAAVFVVRTTRDTDPASLYRAKLAMGGAGNVELALLGVAVFLLYPFMAFSSNLLTGDGILNVYTHGLGLCFGYAVAYIWVLGGLLDFE